MRKVINTYLLTLLVITAISFSLTWLVTQWQEIANEKPVWLTQVLMTMVDPSLPLSVQLRESAISKPSQ